MASECKELPLGPLRQIAAPASLARMVSDGPAVWTIYRCDTASALGCEVATSAVEALTETGGLVSEVQQAVFPPGD